ncbi:MAG TPA: prenyltransferase [Spirochaetia bacterium]|nr:prenyltransferase [Spirochaetia bacterium]
MKPRFPTIRTFILDTIRLGLDLRSWRAGFKALRMPSLVIAAFSCALGIVLAYRAHRGDLINAACVMVAGLAIQAGVNLVNDFFEFRQKKVGDKISDYGFAAADRQLLEVLIFLVGLAFFGVSGLIGLFLAWRSGWPVLLFGLVGWLSGFFYTGEPFNYKRRGLAVTLVFFFMGIIMIPGAAFAVSGLFSWESVVAAVPVSFLISLILLANELRDFESDVRFGIRTLTVRIGYRNGVITMAGLLAAAYLSPAVLRVLGGYPGFPLVWLAAPFAVPPFLLARRAPERRSPIIPVVMLHHLVYGFLYCWSYLHS